MKTFNSGTPNSHLHGGPTRGTGWNLQRLQGLVLTAALVAICASPAFAQPENDLNVRVSIDHKGARAQDVLKSLASAASMTLEVPDEEMSPVTVTLTNARVRTALDAVCENAGCKWSVVNKTPAVLKVVPTRGRSGLDLKSDVSVHLKGAAFEQAFRSLASYLQVGIVLEGKLPVYSVTISMNGASTTTLLDALCKAAKCTWRFEPENKRLVISSK